MATDAFERVRTEPDPLLQARAATDLLGLYQQRSVELARLRRDAIDRVAGEHGMSFTAVAQALGLSKGRITQIRQSAPPTERAFFGVGPVTVAVPQRPGTGRASPSVSREEAEAGHLLATVLEGLNFQVRIGEMPPAEWQLPPGDLVVLCGPISSLTMARAYEADPLVRWSRGSGRFWLVDRATGQRWGSAMDDTDGEPRDLAYLGRLPRPDGAGTMIAIAGLHGIGSLGAVTWLRDHLGEVHRVTGGRTFSMLVSSTHDALRITGTAVVSAPRIY